MAVAQDNYPSKPFEFIAPAGPGGGWDTTIRMVQGCCKKKGLYLSPCPWLISQAEAEG